MPLETPKVPFRRCSTDKKIYMDIHERLQKERILFLYRDLEAPYVDRLIGLLLYINSKGGDALAPLVLYDIIQYFLCDVSTVGMGVAQSGASLILAEGTILKGVAFPHTRIK